MIEIISAGNRHFYDRVIESMFRLRYRTFVEDWGWRIPGIEKGRDCDAFDTEDTVYLVERANDDVVACARLNPTLKPHMFSEAFSERCDLQGVQRGAHIFEASRYAIDRTKLSPRAFLQVKGRLEWAVTWFSLRNQITRLTWFMSKDVYARNIQLWRTTPLGTPCYFADDDRTYIPAISEIDEPALARVAGRYRLPEITPVCAVRESGRRVEVFTSAINEAATERSAA